jgi:hypothetical protein
LNLQNGWQGDVPGVVVAGSAQCVPVAENGSYRLEAKVYVVDVGAAGGVDATFYATADCSSAFSSAQRGAALTATRGAWEGLEVLLSTPAGTRSALLRLVVTKELSASAATVRFDDVSLTLR